MAHRRIASESAATTRKFRPLSILSPPLTPASFDEERLPIQFEDVIGNIEAKRTRLHLEGYILKLDEFNTDGSRITARDYAWQEIYASLTGHVLSVWPAAEVERAEDEGLVAKVAPTFINITDARILRSPSPDSRDIVLSTAGKNRYVLRAIEREDGVDLSRQWLLALRLAMYERTRAQELYTAALYQKHQKKEIMDLPRKDERWAGTVEVRFSGGEIAHTAWTQMWCTVHAPARSGLFKKQNTKSDEGMQELRFFSSKKDRHPYTVMTAVYAAYVVYPEHKLLLESPGMIKVEGLIPYHSHGGMKKADGLALIMPRAPESSKRQSISNGGASSSSIAVVHAMLQMLNAIWTSFELYGRPRELMLNVDHVDALGTGGDLTDLPLQTLSGLLPMTLTDEASWRKAFREQSVLQSHYISVRGRPLSPAASTSPTLASSPTAKSGRFSVFQVRRKGNDRRVVSEGSILPRPARTLVSSIEEDEEYESGSTPLTPKTISSTLMDTPTLRSDHRSFAPSPAMSPQIASSNGAHAYTHGQPTVGYNQSTEVAPARGLRLDSDAHHMTEPYHQARTATTDERHSHATQTTLEESKPNHSAHQIPTSRSLPAGSIEATSRLPLLNRPGLERMSSSTSAVNMSPAMQRVVRQPSHASFASDRSDSVYSGHVDESVLDLVHEYRGSSTYLNDAAESSQTSLGQAESMYSVDDNDEDYSNHKVTRSYARNDNDGSDCASTVTDADDSKELSVEEMIRNRASAVEVLDIRRKSASASRDPSTGHVTRPDPHVVDDGVRTKYSLGKVLG